MSHWGGRGGRRRFALMLGYNRVGEKGDAEED